MGASTGTSRLVTVASRRPHPPRGRMSRREVAYLAPSSNQALGRQSGIRPALRGLRRSKLLEIDSYPEQRLGSGPAEVLWSGRRRRYLLGKSHAPRRHEKVINRLADSGPDCKQLADLRRAAEASKDALAAGDFVALGRAMAENTEAQARLHPEVVGQDAASVIDIARRHGACGWKVNGAGCEGGSVTILGGALSRRTRAMVAEIESADPLYRRVPVGLYPEGLRTWEVASEDQ